MRKAKIMLSERLKVKTIMYVLFYVFFFSSRRRHTRLQGDWSSDVCSSDLERVLQVVGNGAENLALERIGLPEPRPLRGEPAVGVEQVAGAARLDHALQLPQIGRAHV